MDTLHIFHVCKCFICNSLCTTSTALYAIWYGVETTEAGELSILYLPVGNPPDLSPCPRSATPRCPCPCRRPRALQPLRPLLSWYAAAPAASGIHLLRSVTVPKLKPEPIQGIEHVQLACLNPGSRRTIPVKWHGTGAYHGIFIPET